MLRNHAQPMFNLLCRDVDKQFNFYQAILGWDEVEEASSPIYRVLTGSGIQLAFNGWKAYDLLSLADRKQSDAKDFPISMMFTSVVHRPEFVNDVFRQVPELGGRIVKGPFATYYGHWQLVFCDPENNVARVTSMMLPEGIQPSMVNFD
ncbi:VOC family protein [Cupriavidus necator]